MSRGCQNKNANKRYTYTYENKWHSLSDHFCYNNGGIFHIYNMYGRGSCPPPPLRPYRHHNMYTTTHHHIITIEQTTVCVCVCVSQTECAIPRYTKLPPTPAHKQNGCDWFCQFVFVVKWNEKNVRRVCVRHIKLYHRNIFTVIYIYIVSIFYLLHARTFVHQGGFFFLYTWLRSAKTPSFFGKNICCVGLVDLNINIIIFTSLDHEIHFRFPVLRARYVPGRMQWKISNICVCVGYLLPIELKTFIYARICVRVKRDITKHCFEIKFLWARNEHTYLGESDANFLREELYRFIFLKNNNFKDKIRNRYSQKIISNIKC